MMRLVRVDRSTLGGRDWAYTKAGDALFFFLAKDLDEVEFPAAVMHQLLVRMENDVEGALVGAA